MTTRAHGGITKQMKNKLQIVQNKVVRFIPGLHHRKSITYIEFEKLGFLNISNRIKQLRLNHVYNILNIINVQIICIEILPKNDHLVVQDLVV